MPEQFIGNEALFKDPEFLKLSPEAKMKVLDKVDPDFAKLTPSGKTVVLQELTNMNVAATPPGGSTPSQIADGLGMGALKGVGRMGMTTVQWLQHVLGNPMDDPTVERVQRFFGATDVGNPTGRKPTPMPMSLLPQNSLEEAGGMIPQVIVPTAIGVATGGMSIPVQAAIGGLTGGIAAASEGASPGATQFAAGIGGAAPAISAGSQRIAGMLRRQAQERVADAIGPSGFKEKEALSKVIEDVTKRKPFAFSSEGLLKKFTKAADRANKRFDAILNRGPNLINANSVADSIDDVIDKLKIGGRFATPEDAAAAKELMQVQSEIRALASNPNMPNAAKMTDMRALKMKYDKIVTGVTDKNIARTLAEGTRADAAQEGFFKIRQGMIQQNPALEKAGRQAQLAITPRNILARQEISNIKGGLGSVGTVVELGMLASSVASGRVEPAVAAVALSALRHIMASTPRKLISAAARTTLANAIERGNVVQALQLAAQIPAINEKWKELQADVVRAQQ